MRAAFSFCADNDSNQGISASWWENFITHAPHMPA